MKTTAFTKLISGLGADLASKDFAKEFLDLGLRRLYSPDHLMTLSNLSAYYFGKRTSFNRVVFDQ